MHGRTLHCRQSIVGRLDPFGSFRRFGCSAAYPRTTRGWDPLPLRKTKSEGCHFIPKPKESVARSRTPALASQSCLVELSLVGRH